MCTRQANNNFVRIERAMIDESTEGYVKYSLRRLSNSMLG